MSSERSFPMQITNYGTVNISSDVHGLKYNLIRAATVLWRMSMLMLSRQAEEIRCSVVQGNE